MNVTNKPHKRERWVVTLNAMLRSGKFILRVTEDTEF